MTILCQCRQITDEDLKAAFKSAKDKAPEADVALDDLTPDLGEFVCGGCTRIFERAAEQFNDNGEINLFRRSRKKPLEPQAQSGLCSHAQQHDYKSTGVPDLLSSPIIGEPKPL